MRSVGPRCPGRHFCLMPPALPTCALCMGSSHQMESSCKTGEGGRGGLQQRDSGPFTNKRLQPSRRGPAGSIHTPFPNT